METSELVAVVGVLIAALGLLITILKEWKYIERGVRAAGRKLTELPRPSIPRRTFLIVAGVGASAALYFMVSPFVRSILGGFRAISLPKSIVKNPKSGILHHLIACANHLPADANRSTSLTGSKSARIHRDKQVYIAELVGKNSQDFASETILVEAIKASPTSTHLYKYLIGIWGKNKEYDRIHELLSANIAYLGEKAETVKGNQKHHKRYTKAIAELQQRKIRADYLARMSRLSEK